MGCGGSKLAVPENLVESTDSKVRDVGTLTGTSQISLHTKYELGKTLGS